MTFNLHAPLLAIVVTLTLAGCTDRASIDKAKALEAEVEELTKLNSDFEQSSRRLQTQLEAAREEKEKLKAEKARLEEDRDAAGKEADQIKRKFENYKTQYKLSMMQRSPGMHVDDFTVGDTAYRHVVLSELTDTYVKFSHDSGVTKLSVKLLPEPLQDMLGINIPASGGGQVMVTDPALINASRMEEHNLAVIKAEREKSEMMRKLAEARYELSTAKQKLDNAKSTGSPVDALKRHIDDQQNTIATLTAKLAGADINEYQARREMPKLLAVPR